MGLGHLQRWREAIKSEKMEINKRKETYESSNREESETSLFRLFKLIKALKRLQKKPNERVCIPSAAAGRADLSLLYVCFLSSSDNIERRESERWKEKNESV